MRHERAQQPREGLMLRFIEMALAVEEDDAMAQQSIADCGHRRGRQIAGQPYTMDFCTDCRRDLANIEGRLAGAIGTCGGGRSHDLRFA
jgi:hypothetical protein